MSGYTAVIGVGGDDDKGINSGSAHVFVRNGIFWTQQPKLITSDGEFFDFFVGSISVCGDAVVVGAWGDDDMASDSGAAYVFVHD